VRSECGGMLQEMPMIELELTEFDCNECHHDGAFCTAVVPQSSHLPCSHCAFWTQETQEQRQWTVLGFTGDLLVEQWALEKLHNRLFHNNRPTAHVCCATNAAPVKPSTVHCLCFGVCLNWNGQQMERKLLGMARTGPPKLPWWWSNSITLDFK